MAVKNRRLTLSCIRSRANKECNRMRGNDGQNLVGYEGKWDDSADDQPWYQFLRDGANYALGFELKSTGSVKGKFRISHVNCCCGVVSFSVELNDELRLGSASRIPGKIPWIGDTEVLPDNPGGCLVPLFMNVDLTWKWEETIRLRQ